MTLPPNNIDTKSIPFHIEGLKQAIQSAESQIQGTPYKQARGDQRIARSDSLQLAKSLLEKLEELEQEATQFQEVASKIVISRRGRPPKSVGQLKKHASKKSQSDESWREEESEDNEISQESKRTLRQLYSPNTESQKQRGNYIKTSREVRSQLYTILCQQAQLWYEIEHGQLSSEEKDRKSDLLIQLPIKDPVPQSQKSSPTFDEETANYQSFSAANDSLKRIKNGFSQNMLEFKNPIKTDDIFYDDPSPTHKDLCSFEANGSTLDLGQSTRDAPNSFESIKSPQLSLSMLYDQTKHNAPQKVEEGGIFTSEESKEERSSETMMNDENRIVRLPMHPLKDSQIEITISAKDVIKYLKENEFRIIEKNKNWEIKRYSILKSVSLLTKVHEKTLKRIARDGPSRKTGGGRKRLDSDMEHLLTRYIVELTKRGRPPTRGEVKILGSSLSSIKTFGASKGWLDKFIMRAIKDLDGTPNQTYFNIIPYSERAEYERNKPLSECLQEMHCSPQLIRALASASDDHKQDETKSLDDRIPLNLQLQHNGNGNNHGNLGIHNFSPPPKVEEGYQSDDSIFLGDEQAGNRLVESNPRFTDDCMSMNNKFDFMISNQKLY